MDVEDIKDVGLKQVRVWSRMHTLDTRMGMLRISRLLA